MRIILMYLSSKRRNNLLLLIAVLIYSCNNSIAPFPKLKQLVTYLKERQNIKLEDNKKDFFVFILQTNNCGSCTDRDMIFLNKFSEKYITHVILPMNTPKWVSKKITMGNENNKKYLYIDFDEMKRIGLYGTYDMFIHFYDNKVDYWVNMDDETIVKLKDKYLN